MKEGLFINNLHYLNNSSINVYLIWVQGVSLTLECQKIDGFHPCVLYCHRTQYQGDKWTEGPAESATQPSFSSSRSFHKTPRADTQGAVDLGLLSVTKESFVRFLESSHQRIALTLHFSNLHYVRHRVYVKIDTRRMRCIIDIKSINQSIFNVTCRRNQP